MKPVTSIEPSSAEFNGEYDALSLTFKSWLSRHLNDPAHARQVRSDRIEDAIVACYNDFSRQWKDVPTENLTQRLYEKLKYRYDDYGLTAPPKLDTIRPVVYGKLR